MKKLDVPVAIDRVRKKLGEPLRLMMGVDEKAGDADVDQMIEREGDERFLKDRDQRFG